MLGKGIEKAHCRHPAVLSTKHSSHIHNIRLYCGLGRSDRKSKRVCSKHQIWLGFHILWFEYCIMYLYWLYLCASEQRLSLISYKSNFNTYIWSYITLISKNFYMNVWRILIPANIWYHARNTQYIPNIRRHTISAHQLNTIPCTCFPLPPS